jgi:hypothetical protein
MTLFKDQQVSQSRSTDFCSRITTKENQTDWRNVMNPTRENERPAPPIVRAQPAPPQVQSDEEGSGLQHEESSGTGPIVVKWQFTKDAGSASLVVNPDGSSLFSGAFKGRKPGKDFDITLALKSDLGVILFRHAADASNGVEWSKQGQSEVLKDNFNAFAAKHEWAGHYDFTESAEGRAKLYQEQEQKKAALKREEEAAKAQHNEQLAAQKKAAREKEEQLQREQALKAAQHGHQSGGGAGSVVSTIGKVLSTVGTIAGIIALF